MKLESKRSAGLKGALALIFIALAGGAAFAFARRDAGPEGQGEAQAAVTSATVAAASKPVTCGEEKSAAPCDKPGEKQAEKPATHEPLDESALPKGEDRAALLALRRLAKSRKPSAEQKAAIERLAKIHKAALAGAEHAHDTPAEREAMTRAFFSTLDREARKPIRERLDALAQKFFFGRSAGDEVYTVKSGDKLITIARAHKTTWSFLKRVNNLRTDSIRVGQKLRIPKGTMELTVFKTDFLLVATIDGVYVKAWDVGTGKEDRTPESSFKITERLEKPTWYAPDGKVYPFGEKENILGTRWLGFERSEEFAGFGIHGTAFPETIGTESSAGCIRMRNEDVEEVYDLIPEGTIVTIVR
jgi:nucleoid-associated protein YgaU